MARGPRRILLFVCELWVDKLQVYFVSSNEALADHDRHWSFPDVL